MIIQGTGPYNAATPGFDRGMQTTTHCPWADPESWIRGSASLDTNSGIISMTIQLETDSLAAGPSGQVKATVKDANGKTLATATSDTVGMGGKPPGPAKISNFTSVKAVPPAVAQNAHSLSLEAQCARPVQGLLGINLADLVSAAFLIFIVIS